ncbi:MAG: cell division protein ZapA [Lachnospiraceae bacterium]|nr:cell division protein ZapA [Lachnospiraceae bacterium]
MLAICLECGYNKWDWFTEYFYVNPDNKMGDFGMTGEGAEARRESMADKKVIKVLIGGKVMTMSGYESEEYMQRVASYINSKIEEYEKTDSFRKASNDIKHRILELNFADSYFKEKMHVEELEQNIKEKVDLLDTTKHECAIRGVMIDDLKNEIEKMQKEAHENEKTILKLQMELKDRDRQLEEKREQEEREQRMYRESRENVAGGSEIRDFQDLRDQNRNGKNRR